MRGYDVVSSRRQRAIRTKSSADALPANGMECVIVAAGDERTDSGGVLGTFTLCGQCYAVLGETPAATAAQDLVDVLTPRELEIAVLVAAGHECKTIARRLRISFHTVRVHLGRIYAKLGLTNRTG